MSSCFCIRKLFSGIWHAVVIEERPKDANRNGASAALRPRRLARPSASSRWDACRAARRGVAAEFRRSRKIDLAWISIGAHHDLGPRRCAVSRCATPRVQSSIITAHAKMQFKLQVHVISRPRRGKRFRPARRSVSNDPIKCMLVAALLLLRGSVMRDRTVIFITTRGSTQRTRKCAPVTGKKGNATSVTWALRHSRKRDKKRKNIFSPNLL